MITPAQEDMITDYGNARAEEATCLEWGTGFDRATREKKNARAALEAEFARLNARVAELEDEKAQVDAALGRIQANIKSTLEVQAQIKAKLAEMTAKDDSDKTSVGEFIYHKGETGVWLLTDGFGNYWDKYCPACGAPMQVMAPGFARCSKECYIKPEG